MALMEFMKLMEPTQLMEGLIYIHGADLSDSIDGAYENNRICVFSFIWWNFRNEIIHGIVATHWINIVYGAKRIYEVDCINYIDWRVVVDGIDGIE